MRSNTGTSTPGRSALSIQHLQMAFGETVVVPDLSLDIAPGEFCCLLGPSGCGKTTLLKAIAGFVQPRSGAIFLEAREITHLAPQRRDLGMVFQNYALFPHLSVFNNIAYGLKRRRLAPNEIRKRVGNILETIGLAGYARRRIHALSGGQQQRVALARVLVLAPKLLLFDEPLSNLDAQLRMSMREEIRETQARAGVPALFVTHDQEEAMQMAQRIAIMEAGRLVQVGTPREIYERPASLFVADFVGQTNIVPAETDGRQLRMLGQVHELPRQQLPPGNHFQAVIRPEHIQLAEERAGGLNGVIQTRHFMGDHLHYRVVVSPAEAPPVILTAKGFNAQTIFNSGEKVSISFALDRLRLFQGTELN
jgi:iron(III) transport system ATP-binding protein